jgi:Flp pilus assembly protein TadG
MQQHRARTTRFFQNFALDERGSVMMIFVLLFIPLMLFTGSVVDYARAAMDRSKLDAAADAAALATVGRTAITMTPTDAQSFAVSAFNALSADVPDAKVTDLKVQVSDSGMKRTTTLTYSAWTPTVLMGLAGIPTVTIGGNSSAVAQRTPYMDFYLLLDNSPSMGVGATTADINTMVSHTSDKCAFACHDTSNSNNYYSLAKKLGVTMRIDVLRTATQQLMDTAAQSALVPNQFRMAIYTFGASAQTAGLTTISPLTADLTAAKNAASAIDLMTVPNQNYNSDMDTNFDVLLAALNTAVPAPGDGSSASSPQKFVFFVSDGVADESNSSACQKPLTGTRCQEPINLALCQTLKNRGVKIAVLYTTYLPLPTNAWYNTWISPFASSIGMQMQSCASPGLYFEVSPTQGISDAMTALFKLAVSSAYLSQ